MNDDIENLRKRDKQIKSNLDSTEVNELLRQVNFLKESKELENFFIRLTT